MARSRTAVCLEPGCPNLQPCPQHPKVAWAGSTRRQTLPPGWSKIRARILRRDPICRACGQQPSTEVDHIADRNDHRDTNLQGLCAPCHAAKTQREAAAGRARARGTTAD